MDAFCESLAHFSIQLSFKSWFLILFVFLHKCPLAVTGVAHTFCLCDLTFHSLNGVFEQNFYVLFEQNFYGSFEELFSFEADAVLFLFEKSFPIPRLQRYPFLLYSMHLIALPFTSTSTVQLELIFVCMCGCSPAFMSPPPYINSWPSATHYFPNPSPSISPPSQLFSLATAI